MFGGLLVSVWWGVPIVLMIEFSCAAEQFNEPEGQKEEQESDEDDGGGKEGDESAAEQEEEEKQSSQEKKEQKEKEEPESNRPLTVKHSSDCIYSSSKNLLKEIFRRCNVLESNTVSLFSTGGSSFAFAVTETCKESHVNVCLATSSRDLATNVVKEYLPDEAQVSWLFKCAAAGMKAAADCDSVMTVALLRV